MFNTGAQGCSSFTQNSPLLNECQLLDMQLQTLYIKVTVAYTKVNLFQKHFTPVNEECLKGKSAFVETSMDRSCDQKGEKKEKKVDDSKEAKNEEEFFNNQIIQEFKKAVSELALVGASILKKKYIYKNTEHSKKIEDLYEKYIQFIQPFVIPYLKAQF